MQYKFSDIESSDMYDSANIIYIAGQYDIFNNIVVDRCKEIAMPKETYQFSEEFIKSMTDGLPVKEDKIDSTNSNYVDFETFMGFNGTYPLSGRWVCSVEYEELSAKQLEQLKRYEKTSSRSGLLVVKVRKYKDYRFLLKSNYIKNSKTVHLIQLSFPSRETLETIVKKIFKSKGVSVSDKAVQLFTMRLSNAYDKYSEAVEQVLSQYKVEHIGYEEMLDGLKGIENYVIDDFIIRLTVGTNSTKMVSRRKIYKMYKSLIESMGAEKLVKQLRNKIDQMIEFRTLINDGTIPILVRYSVKDIQSKLDDDSKIKNISNYAFKRNARIASLTSLEDWYYMKMILNGNSRVMVTYKTEAEYNHMILNLIHRTSYSPQRLLNDIGVKNVLDEELFDLNVQRYNEDGLYLHRYDSLFVEDSEEDTGYKDLEIKTNTKAKCKRKSKSTKGDNLDAIAEALVLRELLEKEEKATQ